LEESKLVAGVLADETNDVYDHGDHNHDATRVEDAVDSIYALQTTELNQTLIGPASCMIQLLSQRIQMLTDSKACGDLDGNFKN